MPDLSKEIKEEMEQLRSDEIPDIDIEMAIQRKYPESEPEIVPHDGEPGIKQSGLTVMQRIKLAEADWIQKQRLEEARQKLKEQKSAPKQEAPRKTSFDLADDLFYKEYYGAVSSGDAGMQYGYQRIPIMIYAKLMRPGIETKRKGLKWDTLTPQEFELAFDAMFETAEAAKKRALAHMNQRSDGPVNRKKP
jgi:AraC-like DNA-binding protein